MRQIERVAGVVSSLFVLASGLAIVFVALAFAVKALSDGTDPGTLFGGILCGLWWLVIPLVLVVQGGLGLVRASRSGEV